MLQNNARVTVVHDATGFSYGVMRTKEGGAKEGDNQLDRPGGMAPPEAFAGTYEYSAVTVGRALKHGVDSGLVERAYDQHGDRFTITDHRLDAKGRPGFHKPMSYSGLLNTSTPPDADANSNDRAVLEMEFTIDRVV